MVSHGCTGVWPGSTHHRCKECFGKVGKTVWSILLTLSSSHIGMSILPQPNSKSCCCCFCESTDDGIRRRHFEEVTLLLHPYLPELGWLPPCCIAKQLSSFLAFIKKQPDILVQSWDCKLCCYSCWWDLLWFLVSGWKQMRLQRREVVKKASLGGSLNSAMENFVISKNWKKIGNWDFDMHFVPKVSPVPCSKLLFWSFLKSL